MAVVVVFFVPGFAVDGFGTVDVVATGLSDAAAAVCGIAFAGPAERHVTSNAKAAPEATFRIRAGDLRANAEFSLKTLTLQEAKGPTGPGTIIIADSGERCQFPPGRFGVTEVCPR